MPAADAVDWAVLYYWHGLQLLFLRISSGLGKFGFPEVILVTDGPLLPRVVV